MFRSWKLQIGSVAGALALASLPLCGDDFEGAAKLVQQLNSTSGAPVITPTSTTDDFPHLNKDLADFSKKAADLPPDEAAKEWLALYNRSIQLLRNPSQQIYSSNSSNLISDVTNVLPGPDTWPEMRKQAGAGNPPSSSDAWSHGMLLLVLDTLNNDETHQWSDLASLNDVSMPGSSSPDDDATLLLMLGSKLTTMSEQPAAVESFWNEILSKLEKSSTASDDDGVNQIELPDLVTLLGAAKAEPLILRALLLPNTKFSKFDGTETQALAQKLALANIDKLQQPPWALTENLDSADLYDALLKKFPADPNDQTPAIYHVLALVVNGKPQDAVTAAALLKEADLQEASDKAAQAGYGEQVYDFLHTLLQAHPENSSWSIYVNLAAQTAHSPEALAFVQSSLAQKDLSDPARTEIQSVLYRALLADDKIDEGIAQLRALIQTAKSSPTGASRLPGIYSQYGASPEGNAMQRAAWDIQLARIGRVLKRDDLEKEGLDDAMSQPTSDELITYLMETGRNSAAEKLLIAQIVDQTTKEKANPQNAFAYMGEYAPDQESLVKLAQVYYNAGRWEDIITLLQQAPGWSGTDLVDIADAKAYSERYTPASLGLMAARALAETGHVDQALPILDNVLQVDGGDDAAYELLLKIGKGDLVAKLDALYQQDQFQNRPLIWKATLLLQQGKVDEAEQACKTAIAVDPSDGETGKGNRMRVYSVMADVCEAKKDPKQADFFRNVVKAIRLSENADDFYDAGLLTRAVAMYGQALDLFSDAYCIQSRIARQLAELGRMDEAAIHYRKAFELMPVSFGRMESHCFGCERAFQGKTAVAIAEKTFTDMLAKDPTKPQLYYLLGYLYMEQEEYPKAVTNFQKAAELDPDYINAWKQIVSIGNDYQLPPALRDKAVFNLLRLDPAGRHTSPDMENIRDLTRLWKAEETCLQLIPAKPASLYPLVAAAAHQAAQKADAEKMIPAGLDAGIKAMIEQQFAALAERNHKGPDSPRNAVLRNGVISQAIQLFR